MREGRRGSRLTGCAPSVPCPGCGRPVTALDHRTNVGAPGLVVAVWHLACWIRENRSS